MHRSITGLYLNLDKRMQCNSAQKDLTTVGDMRSTRLPSHVAGYERIRVVGKGSFGNAILYRRKENDELVIIKEINMHELSPNERQLALNEVMLLSRLHHPNSKFLDCFETISIFSHQLLRFFCGRRRPHDWNGVRRGRVRRTKVLSLNVHSRTLAQLLARREDYMDETEIIYLFDQMISAVTYLHDNNVLHRSDWLIEKSYFFVLGTSRPPTYFWQKKIL